MSKSAEAGLPLSYVNRVGGAVHLRLELPDYTGGADRAQVRLVNGGQSRLAHAVITTTGPGTFLEVTFPSAKLTGTWHVFLGNSQTRRFESTGARVLVAEPNPIALLIGFDPARQVPPPYVPDPVHTLPRKQQWARLAGLVVDRALVQLPPAQATTVRASVRRVARKVSAALPG